jgi:ribosome-associated protein
METITLNDALKLSGLASTGGQAKLLIQSGQVKVNGSVETRRKKQLKEGDVIEVNGEEFTLELEAGDSVSSDDTNE